MGQKQAAFDSTGTLIAFYDSDDSPAPEGVTTIDITDDVWASLLDAQSAGKRLIQGADGAPVAADPLPPSAPEILAANTSARDQRLATAALAIAPLQDAVDLGEATTGETTLLKLWKQYRVAVNRLDLTQASPTWPTTPA